MPIDSLEENFEPLNTGVNLGLEGSVDRAAHIKSLLEAATIMPHPRGGVGLARPYPPGTVKI